jgi:hypothetical protein
MDALRDTAETAEILHSFSGEIEDGMSAMNAWSKYAEAQKLHPRSESTYQSYILRLEILDRSIAIGRAMTATIGEDAGNIPLSKILSQNLQQSAVYLKLMAGMISEDASEGDGRKPSEMRQLAAERFEEAAQLSEIVYKSQTTWLPSQLIEADPAHLFYEAARLLYLSEPARAAGNYSSSALHYAQRKLDDPAANSWMRAAETYLMAGDRDMAAKAIGSAIDHFGRQLTGGRIPSNDEHYIQRIKLARRLVEPRPTENEKIGELIELIAREPDNREAVEELEDLISRRYPLSEARTMISSRFQPETAETVVEALVRYGRSALEGSPTSTDTLRHREDRTSDVVAK